ncbi:hypothetical protein JOC55_002960 [Paenibacillus sacheonensis]|nr:hypothetical protein [Paenibacillus sacheonensis]
MGACASKVLLAFQGVTAQEELEKHDSPCRLPILPGSLVVRHFISLSSILEEIIYSYFLLN